MKGSLRSSLRSGLRSGLLAPLGLVMVLVGGVWFAQGVGWLQGSSMSDETLWAVVGPVVAALGVVIAGIGIAGQAKRRSRDG